MGYKHCSSFSLLADSCWIFVTTLISAAPDRKGKLDTAKSSLLEYETGKKSVGLLSTTTSCLRKRGKSRESYKRDRSEGRSKSRNGIIIKIVLSLATWRKGIDPQKGESKSKCQAWEEWHFHGKFPRKLVCFVYLWWWLCWFLAHIWFAKIVGISDVCL